MKRDDVGGPEQGLAIHIAYAGRHELRVGAGVMRQYPATEAGEDSGHRGPDAPGADYPRRPPVEVEAEQAVEGEVPLPDTVVGAVNLAVEREDERHCVFGDRGRRIGRHPADGDAVPTRSRQIDVVVAGAAKRHEPNARQGQRRNDRRIRPVVHEDADRVCPLRERR